MEEIIIGLVILILIGGAFWLFFPYFLSKFRRDEPKREEDESNDNSLNTKTRI